VGVGSPESLRRGDIHCGTLYVLCGRNNLLTLSLERILMNFERAGTRCCWCLDSECCWTCSASSRWEESPTADGWTVRSNATLHVCLVEFFDPLVFYGTKQCCGPGSWSALNLVGCIRIRDPGGQKLPIKFLKKCLYFMFWSVGCSLLRA
jgi:hypothetical protein